MICPLVVGRVFNTNGLHNLLLIEEFGLKPFGCLPKNETKEK